MVALATWCWERISEETLGGRKARMFAKKYVCDQRLGWDLFSRDWPRSFFTTGCHSFTGACLPKSPLPVHPLHWYCTCTAPCCTALHCISTKQYKAVEVDPSPLVLLKIHLIQDILCWALRLIFCMYSFAKKYSIFKICICICLFVRVCVCACRCVYQ